MLFLTTISCNAKQETWSSSNIVEFFIPETMAFCTITFSEMIIKEALAGLGVALL